MSCSPGSVHSPEVTHTSKPLPVCSECHSAHSIQRTDLSDFRLHIMDQCGRCHEAITASYFETFHGKVSKLGYLKTAKCYDCHGSHDILPVTDPRSRLSRDNIVKTCAKCHTGSHRQFAGYLTHATHHDPNRYPFLFYTFWGMTTLLVGTLLVSGHSHGALAAPLARIPQAADERARARRGSVCAALRYLQAEPAPHGGRQLSRPGTDRHDPEVLLCAVGQGPGAGLWEASKPRA